MEITMSDKVTITTDNKWKHLRYASEVPKKVLDNQFNHQDRESVDDGFIKYRKQWYHIDMFIRLDRASPLDGWHGYHNDSMCCGVIIKLSDDCEKYMIGTFCS